MSDNSGGRHLTEGTIRQAPRSYTYGDKTDYPVEHGNKWLPLHFWRETIACKGLGDAKIGNENAKYSDESIKRQNVDIARSVARYNGWLVVVGLFSAVASAFQWWEIHSGSSDTHALAIAAKNQAVAAAESSQIAKEALLASERAWIGPTAASLNAIVVGKPIKGSISYINSGHQPTRATVNIYTELFNASDWEGFLSKNYIDSQAAFCLTKTDYNQSGVVFPSSGGGLIATSYSAFIDSSRGNSAFVADQEVVDGGRVPVITGCATYYTFGKIRHSFFCYFYKAGFTITTENLNICLQSGFAD